MPVAISKRTINPSIYLSALTLIITALVAGCSDSTTTLSGDAEQGDKPVQSTAEATSVQKPATGAHNAEFLEFTELWVKDILRTSPLFATSLGVDADYVGAYFNDQLGAISQALVDEEKEKHAMYVDQLQAFDPEQLSGTALTTYQVIDSLLATTGKLKPHINGTFNTLSYFSLFPVTQISGAHIDIPRSLQTEHPLASVKDAEDYISRLSQVQPAMEGLAEILVADVEKGLYPPTFAVEGAINFIDQLLATTPSEHSLVTSFTSRLEASGAVDSEALAALTASVEAAVAEQVYIGYEVLKETLEQIVLPKASEHAGVWDLDNGEVLYQLALENFGAGSKTAEEIHQLGLSEVARIQTEMATILASEGLPADDVIASFNALSSDPQYLYPNTDEGRSQLLADLNEQMDEITVLLPKILNILPKAPVEVRRIAEYEQDGAPGGYYTSPSLDGSRPGIYWINLKNTADWPSFTLPTLTYHEASPGHHLQIAIAQEISDMPMLRNTVWFGAYGEGWALYAEVLAKELGLYKDDPLGDLGRLQSELFRAARLVVDTGIHHKRWSREQAIDYMLATTGGSRASVTREIERYAVWPGQACSYKLGQLRILELRKLAKKALGAKFSLAAFNDEVLRHGSISLPVLQQKITAWMVEQGAQI